MKITIDAKWKSQYLLVLALIFLIFIKSISRCSAPQPALSSTTLPIVKAPINTIGSSITDLSKEPPTIFHNKKINKNTVSKQTIASWLGTTTIDNNIVYKDYVAHWLPLIKSQNRQQRRRTFEKPEYRLSYLAFFLDDIARLRDSKGASTISLCLGQSYWESNFGTTDLGIQGNHFGIKGALPFGNNKIVKKKDDFAYKSSFGGAGYAGWASFEQNFNVVKSLGSSDINSSWNPYKSGPDYKKWAWAIQNPYTIHSSCGGRGCSRCRQSGLINTRVYATGKYPGKKPNPSLYVSKMIALIEEHGWNYFDDKSYDEIVAITNILKTLNKE